jgi:hypothetical protein
LADFVVKVVDVLGDGDCGIVQPSYVVRHRADAFQIPEEISPASALLAAETVKRIDLAPEVARHMTLAAASGLHVGGDRCPSRR